MQGSSGTWKLLFPSAEVAGGSNLVRKGESRQIPPVTADNSYSTNRPATRSYSSCSRGSPSPISTS